MTISDIIEYPNQLCSTNRQGVVCGACLDGYSLQLGGYECADCSNSTYKGVLLLIAFMAIGIALVSLLLGLNITVSSGMINGLTFYSNIVCLNSDTLLPISREGSGTHLQNAIRILSTFQAWMNLDFGIVTCFFEGYDMYISAWMQFAFPLYIWLLILMIVLASRYSKRISNVTASHTVPVLATLLLLSYAKILKTSIESFSSVHLQLLDGTLAYKVWKFDGNVEYLGQLHIPLFLASLLMVMIYIIPLTLLVLLGPLLQAKSQYRGLNWVNKLKPFLDAFHGPYSSSYRYWPGVLLLSRLVSLLMLSLYSRTQQYALYSLLTILVLVISLLVIWNVFAKRHQVSFLQKRRIKYLELFFLSNLGVFALASIYVTEFSRDALTHQQSIALAMVGSVLAVFCGILGHHIFCSLSRYKIARHIKAKCIAMVCNWRKSSPSMQQPTAAMSRTVVEMTEHTTSDIHDHLHELLLTDSYS